jgi:hypothetical protein
LLFPLSFYDSRTVGQILTTNFGGIAAMTNLSLSAVQTLQPLFSFRIRSGQRITLNRRWWTRLIVFTSALGLASVARASTIDYAVTSDTRIDSSYTTSNYGTADSLKLIVNSADHYAGSYVRVLVDVPDDALTAAKAAVASGNLTSVKLYMDFWWINVASGESFSDRGIVAHPLTTAFTESGATFLTSDGTNAWTTPGGDYDSSISITWTAVNSSSEAGWYYFDLTSLVAAGYDLSDGLILMLSSETPPTASSTWCTYCAYSAEGSSTAGPYVEVTSVPEPGTAALLFSVGFAATFLFFRRRWRRPQEPISLSNAV